MNSEPENRVEMRSGGPMGNLFLGLLFGLVLLFFERRAQVPATVGGQAPQQPRGWGRTWLLLGLALGLFALVMWVVGP
ncbi:MAG: hypothetical protein KF832_14510 [Caldilineaceae bacterium]|nr:hypothetical protein [Caldilineaceae bacterium]